MLFVKCVFDNDTENPIYRYVGDRVPDELITDTIDQVIDRIKYEEAIEDFYKVEANIIADPPIDWISSELNRNNLQIKFLAKYNNDLLAYIFKIKNGKNASNVKAE